VLPLDPSNPSNQAGPLTQRIADTIKGIQYGEFPPSWSVIVDYFYKVGDILNENLS
jgi:branched-chain amino acid aminotransferase